MTVHYNGGDRPALVFSHYWGGSAATWEPVLNHLENSAMVTWDQRGWGAHADLPGPYGLDVLAGDIEAVVAALDLREVILVGHSQGGKVAQLLARRRPSWLRGLVLVAPAPPRPPEGITEAYCDELSHAYDTPGTAAGALDGVLTAVPLPSPLREQAIHDSIAAGPAARSEWPLHGIVADLGPGAIDVPTALVVGEHDRVEPPEMLRDIVLPTLPGSASMTVVPGAGHLLPLEAPGSVAEAIERLREARSALAAQRGDHPAGARVDDGLAVDDDGRHGLVAVGDGADEGRRIRVAPDVHHARMEPVPCQHEPQSLAERAAGAPVDGHVRMAR